jgi:hypothetical protein
MCKGLDKQKTAKAKIRRPGTNIVEWGIGNHGKLKFMERFAHSPFVPTSAHEEGVSSFLFLKDLVRDGIREGAIRDIDPTLLFSMMASALSGLVARASGMEDTDEREKIVHEGLDFIWNGMKA